MIENVKYEDWREKATQDPEIKAALEELEAAYLVARLRIERQLTQEELAERVGTKQASIARLESGKTQPRLSFLRRVIAALGARIELRVIKNEEDEQPIVKEAENRNIQDKHIIIVMGQGQGEYSQVIPAIPLTKEDEAGYKIIYAVPSKERARQYDKSRVVDSVQ